MAIVEISIVPVGTRTTSLGYYVANCHKVLMDQDKIKYELTAMGTILEGDLAEILSLISVLHETLFEEGAMRLFTSIKIDDRKDKIASINQKINSVKNKL